MNSRLKTGLILNNIPEKRIGRIKEIVFLTIFLVCYLIVLKKYDAISFFFVRREAMAFEGLLSVIIFLIIFVTQKEGKFRYITASLPVLFVYIVFDIYFKSFGSVFKLMAARQLMELIRVADFYVIILIIVFVLSIPVLLLVNMDLKQWRKIVLGASLAMLSIYSVKWNPACYLGIFHRVGSEVIEWSDRKSVSLNGRLAMLLYWEAKREKLMEDINGVRKSIDASNDFKALREGLKTKKIKRNVHLFVLESFFDPSFFSKVKFSRSPMHPNFLHHVGSKPTVSISPIFGGRSAQAEFEVLFGIPAFAEFSDIEFSIFNKQVNYSLPTFLSKLGYITMVTNSFRADFFNSDVAYKVIGFQEIYFPKEYVSAVNSYYSHGDVGMEKYIFDGDLLRKDLDYLNERKTSLAGTPVLNYVVSFYGHFPYYIDYNKRPKVINAVVPGWVDRDTIERMANQFYYRTKALGEILDELEKKDPNAVIVIVGDHLPTIEPADKIEYGYKAYDMLGYLGNISDSYKYAFLYISCSGKKISYEGVFHYNIPDIIYNCITDGDYCRRKKCFAPREDMQELYRTIMGQTLGS